MNHGKRKNCKNNNCNLIEFCTIVDGMFTSDNSGIRNGQITPQNQYKDDLNSEGQRQACHP